MYKSTKNKKVAPDKGRDSLLLDTVILNEVKNLAMDCAKLSDKPNARLP